jgi:(E)-4-hydroxy-3-methyl-but-2-enyl pyrophosphate reductase (IPP and DMAPP forming)
MQVEIAGLAGYCFGVKRALGITETTLKKYKDKDIKVYSIGQIIHNQGVIEDLKTKGLLIVENEEQIEPGSVFIVRSHGMSPDFIKKIRSKGVKIVDTACPFVKRAQSKAKMLSGRGYHLVIIGNSKHPEVLSEMEHADKDNLTIIETPAELDTLKKHKKIGVIMQTTQIKENAKAIIAGLLDKADEILIANTICVITENRQKVTRELAKKVDAMFIVGGKNSANTTHLAQISRQYNKNTHHIENYKEIKKSWLKPGMKAGISGGASTPIEDIKEVKEFLEKL